jgi:hypothetical protein
MQRRTRGRLQESNLEMSDMVHLLQRVCGVDVWNGWLANVGPKLLGRNHACENRNRWQQGRLAMCDISC